MHKKGILALSLLALISSADVLPRGRGRGKGRKKNHKKSGYGHRGRKKHGKSHGKRKDYLAKIRFAAEEADFDAIKSIIQEKMQYVQEKKQEIVKKQAYLAEKEAFCQSVLAAADSQNTEEVVRLIEEKKAMKDHENEDQNES